MDFEKIKNTSAVSNKNKRQLDFKIQSTDNGYIFEVLIDTDKKHHYKRLVYNKEIDLKCIVGEYLEELMNS